MKVAYGIANDTIYAPATPPGKSALAIVRMSGPKVLEVFQLLCKRAPEPRQATLAIVRDENGIPIDQAILIYFPASMSPTGEDVGEFHLHGNPYLVRALSEVLQCYAGLRLALPGEFTRRAVLAGKLDLTAAEALADLIDAETLTQRQQAIRQLYGSLSDPVIAWRDRLLDALALIDADIDFSDEGDVHDDGLAAKAVTLARGVAIEITTALSDKGVAQRIRDGFNVVIAGPPNAGKSSLINCLAGRDVAIVTDIPGTTRDALEVRLDIAGFPVRLVDTAGIRDTTDKIELLGINRSNLEILDADLVLWLHPVNSREPIQMPFESRPSGVQHLLIGTKLDEHAFDETGRAEVAQPLANFAVSISAITGEGIDRLIRIIASSLPEQEFNEPVSLTRARHREALESAGQALARLPDGMELVEISSLVLWAEDIREAIFHLGTVTGHSRPDDVLDRIFTSFCIGK